MKINMWEHQTSSLQKLVQFPDDQLPNSSQPNRGHYVPSCTRLNVETCSSLSSLCKPKIPDTAASLATLSNYSQLMRPNRVLIINLQAGQVRGEASGLWPLIPTMHVATVKRKTAESEPGWMWTAVCHDQLRRRSRQTKKQRKYKWVLYSKAEKTQSNCFYIFWFC